MSVPESCLLPSLVVCLFCLRVSQSLSLVVQADDGYKDTYPRKRKQHTILLSLLARYKNSIVTLASPPEKYHTLTTLPLSKPLVPLVS